MVLCSSRGYGGGLIKTQLLVNAKTKQILATSSTNGKKHDFRQFKEMKLGIHQSKQIIADTGYQGLQKIHKNTQIPHKRRKNQPLTPQQKQENKYLSNKRVRVENVIRSVKIFKIIADKYRNRRKRFGLRFNLISGIYNYELVW
jgi:IS5 family transposase